MTTTYLFVYGTLMQKHDNPYSELIQANSQLIGKGFIYAKKYDLGAYPGIKICTTKTHKTTGELYKIIENLDLIINELDYYEGYDSKNPQESLFIRTEVTVYTDDNKEISAWVYEYGE